SVQAFARRLLARTCQPELHYSLTRGLFFDASAASINRGEYCGVEGRGGDGGETVAARLAQAGVQVFDIQPGLIVTEMTQPSLAMYQQRVDEGLTLLPELGTPAQIGTIVTTLASGGMPYLTGQVISADGGMLVPRF
ncbi:3-ketoacyl-ACP reductase, partial [Raoultella planticola]